MCLMRDNLTIRESHDITKQSLKKVVIVIFNVMSQKQLCYQNGLLLFSLIFFMSCDAVPTRGVVHR